MENSWYKHSPSDWLAGRISRKSFELQGAFIHICQLYWVKHGHFTAHQASLEIGATLLGQLMEAEIIKEEGEQIRIEFLDLQMADLDRLSQRRSEAGRKGGENKAQGIVKQDVASAKQIVASAKQNEAVAKITDPSKMHEARCLFGERRRRLSADYEKDEAKILEAMYKDFRVELRMRQEEVEEEMLQFDGTLSEFYYYIYNKKKQNGNQRHS